MEAPQQQAGANQEEEHVVETGPIPIDRLQVA